MLHCAALVQHDREIYRSTASRPSLIIIFIERDNARPIGVPGRTGLARAAGVEAVAGAFILVLIPEIAALPDAMAQTGEGADDGGVVSQHILRIMAGSARLQLRSTGETPVPPVGSERATHRVAPTQIVFSRFRKPGRRSRLLFPLCGGWEGSLRGGRGHLRKIPPALPQIISPHQLLDPFPVGLGVYGVYRSGPGVWPVLWRRLPPGPWPGSLRCSFCVGPGRLLCPVSPVPGPGAWPLP